MKKCNHIIAYSEGINEAWLEYADRPIGDRIINIDTVFNFCPLCGEKLHPLIDEKTGKNMKEIDQIHRIL